MVGRGARRPWGSVAPGISRYAGRPMPVMFTKGDLFTDHELGAFALGVSCAGNMDAGVALAFKKRWPEMYEDYRARCADKRVHLGDVLVWSDAKVTVYSL